MSNEAMTCVWSAPDAPNDPGPMFVLIILADHAGDHSGEDWRAFPSIERLRSRSKFSRSAVERYLARLVEMGWISRRRRVRPDGKKGIYDYQIHREVECREALREARRRILEAGLKPSGEASDMDHPCVSQPHGPCVTEQHGPCVSQPHAMRQPDVKPCVSQPHHEPPIEPLVEPSLGARARGEPGAQGFDAAFAAYPDSGRIRTDLPKARAAWALAAGQVGEAAMLAAVARYASDDRDLRRGDHGAPAFQAWLSGERWRVWLPASIPGSGAAGQASRPAWSGPAEVRAAVVEVAGESFAVAYLDRCGWDGPSRRIRPWSATAAERLAQPKVAAVLARLGATLAPRQPAMAG